MLAALLADEAARQTAWEWIKTHPLYASYLFINLSNFVMNIVNLVLFFWLIGSILKNTAAARENMRLAKEHMELSKRYSKDADHKSEKVDTMVRRAEAETRVAAAILGDKMAQVLG